MGTTPQQDQTENHHFLPRFYLKGFMDAQKQLWVYERGQTAPKPSKPKYEGHRLNYYAIEQDENRTNQVEDMFSRVESMVAPVTKKLGNRQATLTDDECDTLYTFVALSWVRVPAARDYSDRIFAESLKKYMQATAEDSEAFYARIKDFESQTGRRVDDYEKVRKFALEGQYTATQTSNAFNLRETLATGVTISKTLISEYGYELLYAPSDLHYLTGDNPVVTFMPDRNGTASVGCGFGHPTTRVLMPLNKRVSLLMYRGAQGDRLEASADRVRRINDLTMAIAQEKMYSPEGTRRLARIFAERGCKVRYGENAFMPHPHPMN